MRWSRLQSALELGTRQQVTRLGLLFTMTCVLVALAVPPEQLSLLDPVSFWVCRTPHQRALAPGDTGLSFHRSTARIRGPSDLAPGRYRVVLSGPGPRFLSHPSVRGAGKRPACRLESHGPHRRPSGPRIRARAGTDRGVFPRSGLA